MGLVNEMELDTARKLKVFVFQKDRAVFLEDTQKQIGLVRQSNQVLMVRLFLLML